LFEEFDKDGNGTLSSKEFVKILKEKLNVSAKEEQLGILADCFDTDGDGTIDYHEFEAFVHFAPDGKEIGEVAKKIRKALGRKKGPKLVKDLKAADDDDKGVVPYQEFTDILEDLELGLKDEDIDAVAERYDPTQKKKKVEYWDFLSWLGLFDGGSDSKGMKKLLSKVRRMLQAGKKHAGFDWEELFDEIDEDGNGHIGQSEFEDAMANFGLPLSNGDVRAIMDKYDKDGSGCIEYDEFVELARGKSSKPRGRSRSRSKSRGRSDADSSDESSDEDKPRRKKKRKVRRRKKKEETKRSESVSSNGSFSEFSDDESGSDKGSADESDWSEDDHDQQLKDSLQRAFKFADADDSGTVDRDELASVMWAMGDNATHKEVGKIMKNANTDRNDELPRRAFMDVMAERLEKLADEQGMSEAARTEITDAFDMYDHDNDNALRRKEFFQMMRHGVRARLSRKEVSALFDLVDTNGDGDVSCKEFMRMVEELEDTSKGLPKLVRSALRKLQASMRGDATEYLNAFIGMPTNFRQSVLAPLLTSSSHSMSSALTKIAGKQLGAGEIATASLHSDGKRISPQVFMCSLKGASGVPLPDFASGSFQKEDILRRMVRVSLFYDPPPADCDALVGNIFCASASWNADSKDKWSFDEKSTHAETQRFIVQACNAKTVKAAKNKEKVTKSELCVVFELAFTLKARKPGSVSRKKKKKLPSKSKAKGKKDAKKDSKKKGKAKDKKKKKDKLKSKKKKKKSRGSDSDDSESDGESDSESDSGDSNDDSDSDSEEEEKKENSDDDSDRERHSDDDVDDAEYTGEEIEMGCGWCKLPISALGSSKEIKEELELKGGTPFAESVMDKEASERGQKRTGLKGLLKKAGLKQDSKAKLTVKLVAEEKFMKELSTEEKGGMRMLTSGADSIILPKAALPLLQHYSTLLDMAGASGSGTEISSAPGGCYSLSLFPRVISDGEALYALLRAWDKVKSKTGRKGKDDLVEHFRQTVLRMWPAFHASSDPAARSIGPSTISGKTRYKELKLMADGGDFLLEEEQELMAPFHVKEADFAAASAAM
jgi:Ca2+-binding EF-hand superfamily protein